MKNFAQLGISVIIVIVSFAFNALVFTALWRWFVVFAFNVQPLSLIQALGISFFWEYLMRRPGDEDGRFNDLNVWEAFLSGASRGFRFNFIAFLVGYLITLFQ